MNDNELKYYNNVKNDPRHRHFHKLFMVDENGIPHPRPNVHFRLVGDIPFIEDNTILQNLAKVINLSTPLSDIAIKPGAEPYISPLFEMHKPADGSLLKLNKPISVFDRGTGGGYSYTYEIIKKPMGSQLFDEYKNTVPPSNKMFMFCEETSENKSNLFGTFLLVKYGEEYRNYIKRLKFKTSKPIKDRVTGIHITSYEDEVYDNWYALVEKGIDITEERVRFAMDVAYKESSFSAVTLEKVFGGLDKGISYCADGINNFIETHKFTKEDYTPKSYSRAPEYSLGSLVSDIQDISLKSLKLLFPEKIETLLSTSLRSLLSGIKQVSWELIPDGWKQLLKKAWNLVQAGAQLLKDVGEMGLKYASDALYMLRALLMGFVNGLLSLVQMILMISSWLLKSVFNNGHKYITGAKIQEYQSYMELAEDIYDLLSEKTTGLFDAVKALVKDFSLEKLSSVLEVFKDKAGKLTKYDYAYFTGSFMFEVVVGLLLAMVTGGMSSIVQSGQKFTRFLQLLAREVISTATMGIIDILQILKILITKFVQACKNGWNGFRDFIKNLLQGKTDEIVKTEGKVFDDFNELERRIENLFDHLGGRLYTEKELKLLKIKLKTEFGVDLRLIDKEKGFQKLPVTKNGKVKWIRSKDLLKDWDRRNVVGKFHEGPPPVMILRSNNASELTVFHEKVHMEVWFNKLPKMHIVDEEKYVFEAIFKAKNTHKWKDAELIDAYDYINNIIKKWNDLGKKFPFVNNEYIEQLKINRQFNIL